MINLVWFLFQSSRQPIDTTGITHKFPCDFKYPGQLCIKQPSPGFLRTRFQLNRNLERDPSLSFAQAEVQFHDSKALFPSIATAAIGSRWGRHGRIGNLPANSFGDSSCDD